VTNSGLFTVGGGAIVLLNGSSDVTQSLGAVAVEGPELEITDATDICAAATGTLEATGPPITLRCGGHGDERS
jgi:hypothetical protein